MNKSVDVVLVTFNRQEKLKTCLDGLLSQSYKIDNIHVIDNNSTDGTYKYVKSISDSTNATKIVYYNTGSNLGGAGGFAYGVEKFINESTSDFVWLMDDDVTPKGDCLMALLHDASDMKIKQPYRCYEDGGFVYSEPVSVNLSNPFKRFKKEFFIESDKNNGVSEIKCFPFEGPLLSRVLVSKIGLPDSRYFILADDTEYSLRALNFGAKIEIVPEAVLYRTIKPEPSNRNNSKLDWKSYFYIRNMNFIDMKYGTRSVSLFRPLLRSCKYMLTNIYYMRDFMSYKIVASAYFDSLRNYIDNDLERWRR